MMYNACFNTLLNGNVHNVIFFTEFMKEMLALYGNFTVYCDSTHDITSYADVSLYVLAVRTNCGFQVKQD